MANRGTALAWAATNAWRGDLKLFTRIAETAVGALEDRGARDPACLIQFAVRDDVERYRSTRELVSAVPADTLRAFGAARIEVAGAGTRVEVRFGRKRAAKDAVFDNMPGITLAVTSERLGVAEVRAIRDAVTRTLKRGAFSWASEPARGPWGSESEPDLNTARLHRWWWRQFLVQALFAGVTLCVLVLGYIGFSILDTGDGSDGLPSVTDVLFFVGAVAGASQLIATWLASFIFPAIDIADVTPGRRVLRAMGASGVVSATVGALATLVVDRLPL